MVHAMIFDKSLTHGTWIGIFVKTFYDQANRQRHCRACGQFQDDLTLNLEEATSYAGIENGGRMVVLNTKNLHLFGEVLVLILLGWMETKCAVQVFTCDSTMQVTTYIGRGNGHIQVVGVDGCTIKIGAMAHSCFQDFYLDDMEWFSVIRLLPKILQPRDIVQKANLLNPNHQFEDKSCQMQHSKRFPTPTVSGEMSLLATREADQALLVLSRFLRLSQNSWPNHIWLLFLCRIQIMVDQRLRIFVCIAALFLYSQAFHQHTKRQNLFLHQLHTVVTPRWGKLRDNDADMK
ncbi:LOW QUALITY PROTEIN: hypothetical protein RJ641_015874, partial [Dillenia turbinata]